MRVSRTVAAITVIVGLVVLAPVSAASAAGAPLPRTAAGTAHPFADAPDFTPSPNKWRAYLVNMLSSVLGAATPSKFRAEQLGNGYKYAHSWEQWEASLGIDGVRKNSAGQVVGIKYTDRGAGTFTDVTIANLEEKWKAQAAKGSGPVRTPATRVKPSLKLLGAAGGAVSAYFAYELAATLTASGANAVGGALGVDVNGAVCAVQPDLDGFAGEVETYAMRWMSGQDCSGWELAQEYVKNLDATATHTANKCFPGAGCHVVTGRIHATGTGGVLAIYCGNFPTLPSGWSYTRTPGSGSPLGSGGTFGTCPGGGTNYLTPLRITSPYDPGIWTLKNGTGATVGSFTVADIVETRDDPERVIDCVVTYTDGTSATGSTPPYREGDDSVPIPVCPPTPAGKIPQSVALKERQTVGAPDTETIYDEPVTEEFQDWMTQYPECAMGSCALELFRLTPAPVVSCFDLEEGCVDWSTDPNKASVYQCRYGHNIVALEECNLYAGLFQPGRIATGSPYSDPTTGEWSGGQNSPRNGQRAMNSTVQDPEALRSCDFPDFGMDPVSWVLTPVNCAMERNFVPRPTVVETHFAAAGESWEGKPPAVLAAAVPTWNLAPAATGCSRSATLFGVSFDVLNTCSGPMAGIAAISRIITSLGMLVLVLVLLKRQIAAMVGYNQGQG